MFTTFSVIEKDIPCYTLSYTIKRKRVIKVPISKQKPLHSTLCTCSQQKTHGFHYKLKEQSI